MALTQVQAGVIGNSQAGAQMALNTGVPITENATSVSTSYCITTGSNAVSGGPILLANGATVTIPNGSVWTIV
jgi:hypothetical protein